MRATTFKKAKLKDVCSLVTDGTHDTPKTLPAGMPFIKAKEITGGVIDFENCEYISYDEHLKVIARSKPEFGDTLFAHIGASLGEAALIKTKNPFSIKNVALFKPDPTKIDCRYLYYQIIGPSFQGEIKNRRTGSAQPFVGLDQLRNHEIQVHANIHDQQKIASILSAYDDLIENNTRRIKILEEMAQAIYRHWFIDFKFPGHNKVKFKGKIPEGWELVKVEDIATIYRGRSYKSENLTDNGMPFLNLKCLERDGGFRHDGIKQYTGPYKESQTATAGDIVMAVTDMTQERRIVAHAARVPTLSEPFAVLSMDLVKIVPKAKIENTYLYSMFRYSSFSDSVKQLASGVNVLHLSQDSIGEFAFTLPLKEFRDNFGKIAEPLFQEGDVLQMKNANLRRTRDFLLPKLINGEIEA